MMLPSVKGFVSSLSSLLSTQSPMRNPPHSAGDSHHHSSHGHARRDDYESHEGTYYARGSAHPDSSSVRRPHRTIGVGPVEQNVHTLEHRTGRHTDERPHRSSRRSSSVDATAASQPRRGLERNTSRKLLSQQTQSLEVELQRAQRENCTKDDEIGLLKRHLSNVQTENDHYRTKDAHNQQLLDTQRQELQGARAFLGTTDSYSGGDIIEMLSTLNSEIFQAAAVITDATERAHPGDGSYRHSGYAPAVEEIRKTLGDEVGTLLQGDGIGGESIAIVQAALQTSLNINLKDICLCWSTDGLVGKALKDVYIQIRAQQDQVLVSGTWRSLTRAQSKRHVYHDQGLFGRVVERIKVIFKSERQILSMVFEKVSTILELLARLDEAMNERVTSTDMMLYVPDLGTPFNAQIMEDADGGELSSGTVLFVSEMGLMRVDKDPAGRDKSTVLLKPRVFLQESFFKQETTKAVGSKVQRRE
ncbi:hypothetical protein BDP27DRAFT_1327384 [Rhodocollybia butyracea]|uniref:Uncharacterized protein n=1 Tax=Rhodocollybia butyracea TaxID=206335 RepID=A0A9P5U5Y0_9AGAR|nr:hypothetical protein BDP27DRAFT_1327384 [Rhodocollybia butyracea]